MSGGSADVGSLPRVHLIEELADDLFRSLSAGCGPGRGRRPNRGQETRLNRSQCSYLAWSFVLVLLKIRDAVLIDRVHLSYIQQDLILQVIRSSTFGQDLVKDTVFLSHQPTGQVFLLLKNAVRLRAQASLTPATSVSGRVPPLFVSVDVKVPIGYTSPQEDAVIDAVLQQLSDFPENGTIFQLHTPTHAAVAVAGWLLGYTVIYRFEASHTGLAVHPSTAVKLSNVESQDEVPLDGDAFWEEARVNNLASQPLHLFRVTLETLSTPTSNKIELYSFTCPVAVFDAGGQGTRQESVRSAKQLRDLLQSDVEQRLRSALDILETLQTNKQSGHSKMADHAHDGLASFLSDARVMVILSEVSLPQLAL